MLKEISLKRLSQAKEILSREEVERAKEAMV
jgi:hypothetical protein